MSEKKKTILIIDDDDNMLYILKIMIKKFGYNTVTKNDTKSANEWLQTNVPDLMLVDVMLPDSLGTKFSKLLLSNENLKNVPVIHMSGYMQDEVTRETSMLSGARDFIAKPVDFDKLNEKIKRLIG